MTQSDEPKLSLPVLPTEGGELTEALEDQEQFITFQIGSEEYGLDILTVREVKAWTEITKLPNTAEFILGAVGESYCQSWIFAAASVWETPNQPAGTSILSFAPTTNLLAFWSTK